METIEIIKGLALGIGLSACCGFRIFIPLLMASLAAKFGWLPLSSGFEWMSSLPALICFGSAAVLEVGAYYIPFIDNILDAVSSPAAVAAGVLASASVFVQDDPLLKWIPAIVLGGGTAGLMHAGTGLLRLGSSKLTAGIGNPVVSTTENVFSIGGTLMAIALPFVMFVVVILLLIFIISKGKKLFLKQNSVQNVQ